MSGAKILDVLGKLDSVSVTPPYRGMGLIITLFGATW